MDVNALQKVIPKVIHAHENTESQTISLGNKRISNKLHPEYMTFFNFISISIHFPYFSDEITNEIILV